MLQSDAGFVIGKTHKVCQDYALAGDDSGNFPSVWLSDGCSSSPHTDIGARLLAHKALDRVVAFAEFGEVSTRTDTWMQGNLKAVAEISRAIGVPCDCLNATLLGLICNQSRDGGPSLDCVFYGDGALVYGLPNGERVIFRSTYPANYPYYPAYLADEKRRRIWERVADNCHTITRTVLDANGQVREQGIFCPEGDGHLITHPVADLRWAAILSDGIESFQQRQGGDACCSFTSVDYLDVIRHLTAFKNFAGGFVHRRLQSFAKDCARRGWHHNDDISLAAIYFGESEKER